jgi:hypothetical protein
MHPTFEKETIRCVGLPGLVRREALADGEDRFESIPDLSYLTAHGRNMVTDQRNGSNSFSGLTARLDAGSSVR